MNVLSILLDVQAKITTNLLSVLLRVEAEIGDAAETVDPEAPVSWFAKNNFLIMMLLIFGVFYFLMILPNSKRQKAIRKQRDAMKAGDKVVTSGGIYGKIKDIKDNAVIIEISENVRIKVDKNSVFLTAEDLPAETK